MPTTPKSEEDQKRDEVLRRMLSTPHTKHSPLRGKSKSKSTKKLRKAKSG